MKQINEIRNLLYKFNKDNFQGKGWGYPIAEHKIYDLAKTISEHYKSLRTLLVKEIEGKEDTKAPIYMPQDEAYGYECGYSKALNDIIKIVEEKVR